MSVHEAECPVIIVGGGASGLSAAGALSKLGIRSTILDQDDHSKTVEGYPAPMRAIVLAEK